jgi:hypothetical protein
MVFGDAEPKTMQHGCGSTSRRLYLKWKRVAALRGSRAQPFLACMVGEFETNVRRRSFWW